MRPNIQLEQENEITSRTYKLDQKIKRAPNMKMKLNDAVNFSDVMEQH